MSCSHEHWNFVGLIVGDLSVRFHDDTQVEAWMD